MKIRVISAVLLFCVFCYSCNSDKVVEQQEIIDSLRQANLDLQNKLPKENRNKLDLDEILSNIPNGYQEAAIKAVKYQLKMYYPTIKYSDIRAVVKTDKTVDVIVDVIDQGETNHAYYNISTFDNKTFTINKEWGLYLWFSH